MSDDDLLFGIVFGEQVADLEHLTRRVWEYQQTTPPVQHGTALFVAIRGAVLTLRAGLDLCGRGDRPAMREPPT